MNGFYADCLFFIIFIALHTTCTHKSIGIAKRVQTTYKCGDRSNMLHSVFIGALNPKLCINTSHSHTAGKKAAKHYM